MPVLSFRYKLMLAMMVVVGGVAGATFYVAQQRLTTAQQRFFQQQFQGERRLRQSLQEARLRGFRATSATFARGVRLQALLRTWNNEAEGGDAEGMTERLYQVAEDQFQEALSPWKAPPGVPLMSFFRLLDKDGKAIPPPRGSDSGRLRPPEEQRLGARLAGIFRASAGAGEASVGYLSVVSRHGQARLLEVIFMPVIDRRDSSVTGALVVGFPAPESAPLAAEPSSDGVEAPATLAGGVWLEGELFSRGLTPSGRAALAGRIGDAVARGRPAAWAFDTHVGAEAQRIFFAEDRQGSAFPRACQVSLFSLNESLAEQRALRRSVTAYALLALLAAGGLSWLLAHGLSVPIRELAAGTGEVQRGNFGVKVPVRSRDEIGTLAASFNDMAAGLALKEKYRGILNLVADRNVAEELISGQVSLGGEQREVSVLFCDIRGFTALTQNMPPTEVVTMLNEHFTPLTQVVYENHGVVDKFVGDLIMAVFGAPKSAGRDAANAARCARRMIEVRQALNATSRYAIQVGIGVASGPALAGCMGSTDRLNYTVLGERVNLASRLCSQAGRMEVVIDSTTRERLGDEIQVEPLPPLKLKGYSELVPAFKLAGFASALPPHPPSATSTPLQTV